MVLMARIPTSIKWYQHHSFDVCLILDTNIQSDLLRTWVLPKKHRERNSFQPFQQSDNKSNKLEGLLWNKKTRDLKLVAYIRISRIGPDKYEENDHMELHIFSNSISIPFLVLYPK